MRVILDVTKVSDSVADDNDDAQLIVDELDSGSSVLQFEFISGERQSGEIFRVTKDDLRRALAVFG